VITAVNGAEVRDEAALKLRLAQMRPGAEARLEVARNGDVRTVSVEIAAREAPEGRRGPRPSPNAAARVADSGLGLEVASLSGRVNARLGLPESLRGVVVTNVETFSAAARAGLKAGDIIVEADRAEVGSVDDLRGALTRERLREGVLLRVLNRGDVPRYVVLEMRT
jgi:serine protease Do